MRAALLGALLACAGCWDFQRLGTLYGAGGDDLAGLDLLGVDLTAKPQVDLAGADLTPTPGPKRIFVSSAIYDGNLGGTSGADAKCQALADAVPLGGSWKAWVSDDTSTTGARFTHPAMEYRLVDGTVVAASWTALTTMNLGHAIDKDERGNAPPAGSLPTACGEAAYVWSGTARNGTHVGQDCLEWKSASPSEGSVAGLWTSIDIKWSYYCNNLDCSAKAPIYCFEQ